MDIQIDQKLLEEAKLLSGVEATDAVVQQALFEFIDSRKPPDLRDLRGGNLLDEQYDHKAAR